MRTSSSTKPLPFFFIGKNLTRERINNFLDHKHGMLSQGIAKEETKSGLSFVEAKELLNSKELNTMQNIRINGLMGMATLTDDKEQIRKEFKNLFLFFNEIKNYPLTIIDCKILSMGMTSDYKIALEEGSNMVRIGSAIFGERN